MNKILIREAIVTKASVSVTKGKEIEKYEIDCKDFPELHAYKCDICGTIFDYEESSKAKFYQFSMSLTPIPLAFFKATGFFRDSSKEFEAILCSYICAQECFDTKWKTIAKYTNEANTNDVLEALSLAITKSQTEEEIIAKWEASEIAKKVISFVSKEK